MKKTLPFLASAMLCLLFAVSSNAQDTCGQALPFCTDIVYNFPAGVGTGSAEPGPAYGCLTTQPNPAWYYLQIDQSGNLNIHMESDQGVDIDFALWGPFGSPTAPCTNQLTDANRIDCSYSTAATEEANIVGANSGDYYLLLITNYSDQPTNIIFSKLSGSATTNCDIVIPPLSNNGPLCEGGTLQFTFNEIVGATYSWSGPNGFNSNQREPTIPNVTTAHAGTYTLTVTVDGTQLDPITTEVIVFPKPATPDVSNNSPLCVGETLELSLNSGAVSGATYNWTGPNGFTSNQQEPTIPNVQPNMAGTYSLTITSNGCESDPGTTEVFINNSPNAPVVSSNSPICTGETLELFSDPVSGATYNWTGPNGFTSTQQNPTVPNAQPSMSGNYQLTVTTSGCESPISIVTVAINDIPVLPSVSNNGPLCVGETLELSLNSGAISGAIYSWTGPNGFTSNQQEPTIPNMQPNMAGIYSLAITSNGCESDPGTTEVIINNSPNAPVVSSNSPICTDETLELFADPVSGATYSWTGPNGFSSNFQNPTIENTTAAMSGNYGLSIEVNGCVSPEVSINVDIFEFPPTPVLTNNGPLCVGETLTIESDVDGAQYLWTFPDGSLSTDQNIEIENASLNDAGDYSLVVTLNNCQTEAVSTTINIHQVPEIPEISSNGPLCVGSQLELTSTATGNYTWTLPDGTTSNDQSIVIDNAQVANAGSYTLVTEVNGCISPEVSINVDIFEFPPTPVLTNNGPLCVGETLTIESDVDGAQYLWTFPDGSLSTDQNIEIENASLNDAGDYSLVVTLNNCQTEAVSTTINIHQVPEIPEISSNGPLCVGSQLELTSTATGNYTWTLPDGTTSNDQSIVIDNAQVANAGSYTLVTEVNGCVSPEVSINVDIFEFPPTPVLTNNGPLCVGETLTIESDVDGAQYLWTFPDGSLSTDQNIEIENASLNDAGDYSLVVTLNNCQTEAVSTTINIHQVPEIPEISSNGPLCVGSQLELTSTATGNYTWTLPDGTTSNDQSIVIDNAQVANAGSYTLVTEVNGCVSPEVSINVDIFEFPPTPVLTNNGPLCVGETLTIESDVDGAQYLWTFPDGSLSTDQNIEIENASLNDAGDYSLVVTLNNCQTEAVSTTINIHQVPEIPEISSNGPLCVGSQLELTSTATGNYTWTLPDGTTSNDQSIVIDNAQVANAGSYTLVTEVNGCVSPEASINVDIFEFPDTPEIDHNDNLCSGESLLLETAEIAGASYRWTGPLGFSSTEQNPIIENTNSDMSGEYTLTTEVNGCKSQPASSYVTIHSTPLRPEITQLESLCDGGSLQLSTESIAGAIYHWEGPNEFSSNLYNPKIETTSAKNSGLYTLWVEVNGCASPKAEKNVISNNLPEFSLGADTTICPGDEIELYPGTFSEYRWNDNSTYSSLYINEPGEYWVEVTDANNCKAVRSIIVEERCEAKLWMPNAFTPNNDGLNDELIPNVQNIGEFELKIFNRWGELIFVSFDVNSGWNGLYQGNPAPSGVYVWKATYQELSSEIESKRKVESGRVNLLK